MPTTRAIGDQVRNALDYLRDSGLAHFTTEVSIGLNDISWHPLNRKGVFIENFGHPTIDQYVTWLTSGDYSALLYDGSLIQVSYAIEGGEISRHRLCYFPCPYDIDRSLLVEGLPAADVVELYRDTDAVLRSPIRFDFNRRTAARGHPASHFTVNGNDCRIACAAPFHVMRFLDFIFRHFHMQLHSAHRPFFAAAYAQHIGPVSLEDDDRRQVHLMWDVHATMTGGQLDR